MIGALYIRLEQAAADLDTDADTLLIAAWDGSIKLVGLLAEWRQAELVLVTEDPFDEAHGTVLGTRKRFFGFVPIPQWAALVLLKNCDAQIETLTDEHSLRREKPFNYDALVEWSQSPDNGYWRDAEEDAPALKVSRGDVFVPAECYLEIVRKGKLPDPHTVPDAPMLPRKTTLRDNSLLSTVAALLATFPTNSTPTGKDLEKAAQSVGLAISDDTIRKVLDAARQLAPKLPPPK